MAKAKGKVIIDVKKCKGCGLCVAQCPMKTIGLSSGINEKGFHYCEMQKDNCIACKACALLCPDAVITVYKSKSADDGK